MCIRHSCSLASEHTNTHTDASLHWAVLACFVAFAHRLFSPSVLLTGSREKEEKKQKKKCINLFFVVFMLSRTSLYPFFGWRYMCRFQKHILSFGIDKFSDLDWSFYLQKLEQVALLQHVALRHVKQDTAVSGSRLLPGTFPFFTARNASPGYHPGWMII